MRLELGCAVRCTDGDAGALDDVVIDPTRRRVTHLVVAPHHRHDLARLVPIGSAGERAPSGDEPAGIALSVTLAELEQFEPLQRSAFLRLGETLIEDPEWEVGVEEILALPYYQSLAPGAVGPGAAALGFDDHITEVYDRIPKDEIEIRRASAVLSADGHGLGHVDGFLVDGDEAISHLVLEHGHLWGRREVTIPIGAVAEIATDEVRLSLTREAVQALQSVPVHRWSRPSAGHPA